MSGERRADARDVAAPSAARSWVSSSASSGSEVSAKCPKKCQKRTDANGQTLVQVCARKICLAASTIEEAAAGPMRSLHQYETAPSSFITAKPHTLIRDKAAAR